MIEIVNNHFKSLLNDLLIKELNQKEKVILFIEQWFSLGVCTNNQKNGKI